MSTNLIKRLYIDLLVLTFDSLLSGLKRWNNDAACLHRTGRWDNHKKHIKHFKDFAVEYNFSERREICSHCKNIIEHKLLWPGYLNVHIVFYSTGKKSLNTLGGLPGRLIIYSIQHWLWIFDFLV